ncbi:aldose epimerase family protein [Gilvimarinus polysaccharolyticus]|uniref:aldose epimerase family protein n=1 Tax=Gilvimarinus polysaccharolyticus TaxID=863921 RepID=UPI0006734999|nr:aldose epimerase family protein [Gilvimarinus polysaccharolyticus]
MTITSSRVTTSVVGHLNDGQKICAYTLNNHHGVQARIIDFGATLMELLVPDRTGSVNNVVLGYDTPEDYQKGSSYLGAVVGRVANRIKDGRFSLAGKAYSLVKNDNNLNHLHGGEVGFDKRLWRAEILNEPAVAAVAFHLTSDDGDEGYPGTLSVSVIYRLHNDNTLSVEYQASTTATTVVNLTQHSYFNLAGAPFAHVGGHELQLNASRFTPTDDHGIPTGEQLPVPEVLDFCVAKPLSCALDSGDALLQASRGLDHNFCIDIEPGTSRKRRVVRAVAEVYDPSSGRRMTVRSSYPGVQLYTGNYLAEDACHERQPFLPQSGFCLECQYYPDAPNRSEFDSIELRAGQLYRELTSYHFSW